MAGTWHLERRVDMGAAMQGLAHIRPTDVRGVYGYHEEGSFTKGDVVQEFYRDYLYKVKDKTLNILFVDQHRDDPLYVSLDFSDLQTASDPYLCGDDIYAVVFEIISANEFQTETIVSGPDKDYRLMSHYRRL